MTIFEQRVLVGKNAGRENDGEGEKFCRQKNSKFFEKNWDDFWANDVTDKSLWGLYYKTFLVDTRIRKDLFLE